MAISIYNPYEFSFVLRLLNGNSGVAFSQTGTFIVACFFCLHRIQLVQNGERSGL